MASWGWLVGPWLVGLYRLWATAPLSQTLETWRLLQLWWQKQGCVLQSKRLSCNLVKPGETGCCFRSGSHVWPMSFSWSSYVAQGELLALCHDAGLTQDAALSRDAPTPSTFQLVFGPPTDDVVIFSTAGPGNRDGFPGRPEDCCQGCQ